eukprot:TRINITY_DN59195_c0_g1_i1.p2 TRINITY_DN59195_c0_g1~~TRINITY_DN59195_c0_g1_i1.p2  ORF type:complete len:127 (+),score=19.68 TRINITY_DN59195_c0_g1_i1:74-454(+)
MSKGGARGVHLLFFFLLLFYLADVSYGGRTVLVESGQVQDDVNIIPKRLKVWKKFKRVKSVRGANDTVKIGDRVQTQYTVAEGGNDGWYWGTVHGVHKNGKVNITYDDGDKWSGPGRHVYKHRVGP